mgnify:CR=1 FL=1|jgi:hypothetical protein
MKKTKEYESLSDITDKTKQAGFTTELTAMLMHNKKWWLTPIILVLLLFGFLIILGGSSYAPFIYTLF